MSISVLQEREFFQSGSASNVQLAFLNPVNSGSSIHAAIRQSSSGVTFTCSDNLNGSYGSPLSTFADGATNHAGAHFKFDNATAGTPTVTITPNSSQASLYICIREIGQSAGFDVQATHLNQSTGTGADAQTSNTATPSQQPGLISAFMMRLLGSGTLSAGTGFTPGLTSDPGLSTESLRYISTAAIAATATDSVGTDQVVIAAAFFKEGVGSGGPQSFNQFQAFGPSLMAPFNVNQFAPFGFSTQPGLPFPPSGGGSGKYRRRFHRYT